MMVLSWSWPRSTMFRLISMSCLFLYTIFGLIYQHQQYYPDDEKIMVKEVSPQIKNLATKVIVGLHIINFSQFSFNEGKFLMDAIIWFKYPVATQALKVIENFTFQKAFMMENGELLYRSKPNIKLLGNDVLVSYYIQTLFTSYANFKYFPIGKHTLNIVMQNRDATPEVIFFQADEDNFTLEKKMFASWIVKSINVATGYVEANLHKTDQELLTAHPVTVFSLNLETSGKNDLFSLFFPLLIIFLVLLFSFFYEIGAAERMATVTAVVPSLILFKLVINSMAPQVAYVTHIDYFFYGLALLSLGVFFFQMYITLAIQKYKDFSEERQQELKNNLAAYNDVFFIFCLLAFWLLITYSFWR